MSGSAGADKQVSRSALHHTFTVWQENEKIDNL